MTNVQTAAYVTAQAAELEDQLIAWRRDFHMHPELGFEEHRTAGIIARELQALGLEVATGVGKTGVVAVIGDSSGGAPVIGIRADMDALPIHEVNDVAYRSTVSGKMHACGHDAHSAILLGVARMLTAMPDRPAGEIRLIFQPSEEMHDSEGKSGGRRMVEEGALDGVDHVIALHVNSEAPAGKVSIHAGYLTAATDDFVAHIIGRSCHGAYPHEGIDPIFIVAQVINAIQGARARRIDQTQAALVTIGQIHGGSADNVIPDRVRISGTIRTYADSVRQALWQEVENAVAIARAFGGDYEFELIKGYPSVINDAGIADLIRRTTVDLLGDDALYVDPPGLGGEDFSYMTRRAPGAMFMLGAKKDEQYRPHHNEHFDLDESVFKRGAAVLAETTLRLLRGEK